MCWGAGRIYRIQVLQKIIKNSNWFNVKITYILSYLPSYFTYNPFKNNLHASDAKISSYFSWYTYKVCLRKSSMSGRMRDLIFVLDHTSIKSTEILWRKFCWELDLLRIWDYNLIERQSDSKSHDLKMKSRCWQEKVELYYHFK